MRPDKISHKESVRFIDAFGRERWATDSMDVYLDDPKEGEAATEYAKMHIRRSIDKTLSEAMELPSIDNNYR